MKISSSSLVVQLPSVYKTVGKVFMDIGFMVLTKRRNEEATELEEEGKSKMQLQL